MKLALIGVGLIGGSFAAALRAANAVTHVTGFDTDANALMHARERALIDAASTTPAEAVRSADVVVIATPVGAAAAVLADIAADLPTHTVVTDVGSTKASVIAAARGALGTSFGRFVPMHPIAGGERPGIEHADACLFAGKVCISTPHVETQVDALERVEGWWRAAGARVERMAADEHDRLFAAVSHLPHVAAFALVAMIAAAPDAQRKFALAGAGFRDFTRIAASSPAMWRDICVANAIPLAAELRAYRDELDRLQHAIEAGDGAAIEHLFAAAARARRTLRDESDGE